MNIKKIIPKKDRKKIQKKLKKLAGAALINEALKLAAKYGVKLMDILNLI